MNNVFDLIEKILMAIIWFIPGLITGCLIRLFNFETQFVSLEDLLWQYSPWLIGFGLLFSSVAFIFPRFSSSVIEMVLGIEFGS